MKRSFSLSQWCVIVLLLVPSLVCPSGTRSLRAETDISYDSTASLRNPYSPFAITYSSDLNPTSQEEDKTDSKSYEYVDSDESGVTEQYLESATRPLPSIPPALRRHFSRTSPTEEPQEEIRKQSKTKSKRRRKVKRPSKKSTTPKVAEDDLGIPENSNKTDNTGEKNLAVEIGSDDGKYALINVFFDHNTTSPPPGIVSYLKSGDFSKDNDRTLGNLQENEIWLSEGNLLILKGGDFDVNSKTRWKPIDAYQRDKPALRIPLDTDNPPPFPVFVNESGPPIFLGDPPPFPPYIPDFGSNETFDPSRLPPPGLIPLFPNGTIPNFLGPPPPGFNRGNNTLPPPFQFQRPGLPGQQGGVYGNSPPNGVYGGGSPGPGYGYGNLNDSRPLPPVYFPPPGAQNNSGLPPPFYPFSPPNGDRNGPPGPNNGAPFPFLPPLVLNPNDNETDDPSIFLPPPYDFDYYEDNSTIVPPGPFAPGLVVPPPKDFYTVYNKTSPAPVSPTRITPVATYDIRSQRPNAKKPKFPITNPPDDSLEVAFPVTTSSPGISTTYAKKRKQRPGKTVKIYSNPLLGKQKSDSTSEEISEEITQEPPNNYNPVILIPRPLKIATTTSTTPPSPNYVYVRGQLKTLAEIEAEQAIEEGFAEKATPITPRPPFDELGYPSRTTDDNNNQPVVLDFQPRKTTTKVPLKSYYQNTPKYTTNSYTPNVYIKKKDKYTTAYPTTLTRPFNQGEQNLIQPSQTPIIFQQSPQVSQVHTNNDGNLYYQDNYTRQKALALRPSYFNPIFPSQNSPTNPTQLHVYDDTPQRQSPHSHLGQTLTRVEPSSISRTNSGFRPAFGPPQVQQQPRTRTQILFPGQANQQSLPINPILQHLQNQGYYSPITQYRQPLDGQNLNTHNTFYPSQSIPGSNYNLNNVIQSQFFSPQQFYQPQYHQQIQPTYNPANNFIQQPQQQQQLQQQQQQQQPTLPLHRDILVNYREPLPQYNTESEAITTRPIIAKAGPASSPLLQYGSDATGAGSSTSTAVQSAGSFYSFQRGGPGGFSYKIRL